MRILYAAIQSGFLVIFGIGAAQAATVLIATDPGTLRETQTGVRMDTSTRGADLAGMEVTATFGNGTVETAIWQQFDPYTFGGLNGTNFSMSMGGFPASMNLTTTALLQSLAFDTSTSLSNVIDGVTNLPASYGASVFDISPANEGTQGNTPTSLFGFPLSFDAGADPAGLVTVTYSDAVSLGGNMPAGDLYTGMLIDFSALNAGGFLGTTGFTTDLDTLAQPDDLRIIAPVGPEPAAVPLPAGLPLLLTALAGFGLIRRR